MGGLEETLTLVRELKLVNKADKGVYGHLKREMWRESLQYLEGHGEEETKHAHAALALNKEQAKRERKVQDWEARNSKL